MYSAAECADGIVWWSQNLRWHQPYSTATSSTLFGGVRTCVGTNPTVLPPDQPWLRVWLSHGVSTHHSQYAYPCNGETHSAIECTACNYMLGPEQDFYYASDGVAEGFGQEAAIKSIWDAQV